MNFNVRFEQIADQPARTAIEMIERADKKTVGDLRIYDLIREGDQPSSTRNGVYLFFSPEGECLYVGKNSAQAFVERIPWHFAIWEESWMNHLLKRTKEHHSFQSLVEAADYVVDHQLLLVPIGNEDGASIKLLEKFFRLFLNPLLNRPYAERTVSYYHRRLDLGRPLREVLGEI